MIITSHIDQRHAGTLSTVLLVGLVLSGCKEDAKVAAPVALPVLVQTVAYGSDTQQRSLSATVQARDETAVAFRAAGRVTQRLVEVGDHISAGQTLARVDAADYELGVSSAADQLRAATVEATQQRLDAERLARLVADGSVGKADLERQKSRADAASAQQSQAARQLALAKNRAGYTTLTAPFSGVVTQVNVDAGQVIAEGQPVMMLAKDGALDVVADIPEQLVSQLGQYQASVSQWHSASADQSVQYPVRLRELSPMANPQTRTYSARFSPAPSVWRLGMTAQLVLSGGAVNAAANTVQLPATSVMQTGAEPFVWQIDGSGRHVRQQPVQIVRFAENNVLLQGLEAGRQVVTVGAQKLDAKMLIRPVDRATALGASTP